jgi:hypothetical protein
VEIEVLRSTLIVGRLFIRIKPLAAAIPPDQGGFDLFKSAFILLAGAIVPW